MISPPRSSTAQTADQPSAQPDAQAGLSLHDAAAALGVSVLTVRRKIKRGELPAERVPTPTGFVYRVMFSPSDRPSSRSLQCDHQPDRPDYSDGDPERLEMLRMIERQQQTIMELSGQLGYFQARIQQLQAALEAPKVEQTTPEPSAAAESTVEPAGRPWWRRVFGL
jgi:excisionase family DNA binding protein